MDDMLNFVSKYSTSSFIGGLKIKKDYFNLITFWPELFNMKEQCLLADAIWPKEAYKYFYENYNDIQPVYQTNYCALMKALNKPAICYYNTNECKNCNICSNRQRKKCEEAYSKFKEKTKEEVLKKLNYIGYNDVRDESIKISSNTIKIKDVNLSLGDIAYLTFALDSKIISEKSNNGNY